MKLFSKLLVGLGLAALPAFCAPLALNGVNDWYGFYWNQTYAPPAGVFPAAYATIPAGAGAGLGAEGTSSNLPNFPSNVVYVAGPSTVLGFSPLGGPDVATFTVGGAGGTTLAVTDLAANGDYFAIYDNGALLGSTASVAYTGATCGMDPAACIVNAGWSHGVFNVTAGDVIAIVVASNNFNGSGIAAFQLGGTGQVGGGGVPEPTTISLMALGLGGLLIGRRKQRG